MAKEILMSSDTEAFLGKPLVDFIKSLPDDLIPRAIFSPVDADNTGFWDATGDQAWRHALVTQIGADSKFEQRLVSSLRGENRSPAEAYPSLYAIRLAKIDDKMAFLAQIANLPPGSLKPEDFSVTERDLETFVLFHELTHISKHIFADASAEYEGDKFAFELYKQAYEKGLVEATPAQMMAEWEKIRALAAPKLMTNNDRNHYLTTLATRDGEPFDQDTLDALTDEFLHLGDQISLAASRDGDVSPEDRFSYYYSYSLTDGQSDRYTELSMDENLTDEQRIKLFIETAGLTPEQREEAEAEINKELIKKGNVRFDADPKLQYKIISEMLANGAFENSEEVTYVMQKFLDSARELAPETFGVTAAEQNATPAATPALQAKP